MELKKYTVQEAEITLEKLSIILGLNEDNIPGNKKMFIELFISEVLNVYGEELIYERISEASKGNINIDLKFYNKPISIIWFIELCKTNKPYKMSDFYPSN
jgi:hypothetical protein